jgi:antitoxin PrlF
MKSVVSEKGQVTIPKPLRDRLGLRAGEVLDFSEDHGVLMARKVTPSDPVDEVFGILGAPVDSDTLLAELRGDVR